MPKIKNVSPFGDLDIPLLGQVVGHGKIVEVTDEQAAILLQQPDNFQAWGPAAHKAQKRADKLVPKPEGDLVGEDVTGDDDAA